MLSFWELSPCSPGDLILFPVGNENTPLYSKPASLNISLTFSIIRVLLGTVLLLVINTMNKCCGYLGKKIQVLLNLLWDLVSCLKPIYIVRPNGICRRLQAIRYTTWRTYYTLGKVETTTKWDLRSRIEAFLLLVNDKII